MEAPRTVPCSQVFAQKQSQSSPESAIMDLVVVNALIREEVQEPNSKTQERTDMEYNTTIGVDVSDKTTLIPENPG